MAKARDDVIMEWVDYWMYFTSDRSTDTMREFDLKYLYLPDCLSGASDNVQKEILEYCPDWVKNLPEVAAILSNKPQTTTSQKVTPDMLKALARCQIEIKRY